jgi:glycosyltransferase involved in cell wall biosynthesis
VVVCSRDRADQLTRCLKSLNNLDYPHFEVVVVDNASTDERTKAVTLAAGARYLRENRPGLDFARNAGWRASRFNLVAYTDDDVEVNSNWLRGVASAFTDDTVRAMTGLVIAATMSTEAERCFELGYGGMGKGVRPRRFDPRQLRPADLLGAHHCGVGANMAFRRSTLERLGGFDTALDVGTPSRGGGDLDVFHRTLAAGWVLRYQPTAIVRHHHRQTLAALRRQHADNGRAFGVYLLTILRTGTVGRLATVRYGLGTWFRWLVSRIIGRLRGREPLPMTLLLAELGGALTAPWAYLATHYRDRRLGGRSFS